MRRRSVIPNPFESDLAWEQFHHRDVRDLAERDLWAELAVVEAELAHRIASGIQSQIIYADDRIIIDASGWLETRVRLLRAERRKRRTRRAA